MADKLEEKVDHPLNGKYIVFNYTECDYEDEGSALALYHMKDGKLEDIFSPGAKYNPDELNGMHHRKDKYVTVNEIVLDMMKKLGIKEVYSVFHSKDFFHVPHGVVELSENLNDEGEIEEWCEYNPLCTDSEETDFLKENGIEVKFHHES